MTFAKVRGAHWRGVAPFRVTVLVQCAQAPRRRRCRPLCVCLLPSTGERIIKYWPMPELAPVQMHTWSVCAMCEGSGEHSCFNCLGSGMENKLEDVIV